MTADHAAQEELSFLIRTVPSVLESHQIGLSFREVHGLYHRSGIAPCPKDHSVLTSLISYDERGDLSIV